jgi:hypothetical protein
MSSLINIDCFNLIIFIHNCNLMINKILDQLQDIDDKEDHDRNVKQYSQWVSKY